MVPASRGESAVQERGKVLAGNAVRHCDDLFGRPARDDLAASDPASGAKVEHIIRRLDDIEIVLDDDDTIALVDQPVEHFQ